MLHTVLLRACALCTAFTLATGCVSYHDLVNFNDARLPEGAPEAILNAPPLIIQENDLLRITVNSYDVLAAAPFNIEPVGQSPVPAGGGGDPLQTLELFAGYSVGQDGYIEFPVIGRVRAEGLTLEELRGYLRGQLETYLKEPAVNIRFINFKVTVLGAVALPGIVRVTNPRVTVLEALGYAGDLTDYADRSDVLVVREEGGERVYAHLDLHSDEVFGSPFFYLRQNDLIYVKPTPARAALVADRGQRIVQYVTPFVSVAALVVAILNTRSN